MHYNVSSGMQAMALQVIRNHPNAWDVQFLRKKVIRADTSGVQGDTPNFGGIGVLDSQDENAYEYEFLSNGHALKAEIFQAGNMTERLDMAVTGAQEFVYMIAPSKPAPQPQGQPAPQPIELKTKDLVLFVIGIGQEAARAAYEIASVDATCELPPFLPRYVLNRRDELDLLPQP